jgi:2-polyprenyl-3-methyl-5-hydroxy-6-metoxy-1,4-benzoquinol methylase
VLDDVRMTAMETDTDAACPLCGKAATFLLRARDLNRRTTDETFLYYRCAGCSLIFLFPIPPDPARYYVSEYYTPPSSLGQLEIEAASEDYKIEHVGRFSAGGRVLDIGAGYGRFVCLAHKAGYDIDAIEIDGGCCDFITRVIGTRAIAHGRPEVPLAELEPYDVITSWHALEHLADPWSVLRAAVDNLRLGGCLILSTPNTESLQFRLFGRYWAHLDAPRHLQLLPLDLVTREVTHDGRMRRVDVTTIDRGSLAYNELGWAWSVRNVTRVKRTSWLGRGLARALRRYEEAQMRGSCYTAVFRKHD